MTLSKIIKYVIGKWESLKEYMNKPIAPPPIPIITSVSPAEQETNNVVERPIPIPFTPYQVIASSEDWRDYPPEEKTKLVAMARAICFNEELGDEFTTEMLATICGESGWNPNCVNRNIGKDGILRSTDYGLCQINDYYHFKELGLNNYSATHDVVKCLTYMARTFKVHPDWWVAHQNNNWRKFIDDIPK